MPQKYEQFHVAQVRVGLPCQLASDREHFVKDENETTTNWTLYPRKTIDFIVSAKFLFFTFIVI